MVVATRLLPVTCTNIQHENTVWLCRAVLSTNWSVKWSRVYFAWYIWEQLLFYSFVFSLPRFFSRLATNISCFKHYMPKHELDLCKNVRYKHEYIQIYFTFSSTITKLPFLFRFCQAPFHPNLFVYTRCKWLIKRQSAIMHKQTVGKITNPSSHRCQSKSWNFQSQKFAWHSHMS